MANPNWKPGISGNPAGRPKKERALTRILELHGDKFIEYQGSKITAKHLLANLLWQLALKGEVELPGGETIKGNLDDWLDAVKLIYSQVDGPPKQELDVSGELTLVQVDR